MTNALYQTDCRECGKEMRVPVPVHRAKNDNEGVRARCNKCGTTNFISNRESELIA